MDCVLKEKLVRTITTLSLATGLVLGLGNAQAHFVFILPDTSNGGRVVFSDAPEPDDRVDVTKLKDTKLTLVSEDGTKVDLSWKLDEKGSCYTITIPGSGTRHVLGTTDYGVLKRGDAEPFWLKYHSKAIFGPIPANAKQVALEGTPVEIVPVVEGEKIRFRAFRDGKPYSKATMRIHLPNEEKAVSVTTDEMGLSPAYESSGTYAVMSFATQEKSGVHVGQKYTEVRDYATLVAVFGE